MKRDATREMLVDRCEHCPEPAVHQRFHPLNAGLRTNDQVQLVQAIEVIEKLRPEIEMRRWTARVIPPSKIGVEALGQIADGELVEG